ncbi:MAG: CHAT domain-containing tetratricopeptide repeat protein, partial [Hyphomicrobiales bacterium]
DPNYGFTYVSLGRVYFVRLQYDQAGQLFEQALELFTEHLAPDHLYFTVTLNNLAEVRKAQGRYQETEALLLKALAINEKTHGPRSHLLGPNLNNLADLYRLRGRYEEAETLMRKQLDIMEAALGPGHITIATSLNNLALMLIARGRSDEAALLLLRALSIQEKALGADHPDVASTLNNLADALFWSGKADKARALLERSLAIRVKHFGRRSLALAGTIDNLANLHWSRKHYAEAEPLMRRALAIRETHLPPHHPHLALSLNNLAVVLDDLGRHAEARPLHERALEMRRTLLGPDHPDVANSLNNLGANDLDRADWQAAHDHFKRSNGIWTARYRARTGATGDVELKRFPDSFLGFIRAGFELAQGADGPAQARLADEAFRAAQWVQRTDAADAVAKMSARIAAGSGPLSALMRRQQDLANQAQALDAVLLAHMSKPVKDRTPQAEQDLKRQIAAVFKTIARIDDELAVGFPRHTAMTRPAPLSIARAQELLRADEALYTMAITASGSFAWIVTATEARWVRVPLTRDAIADHVAALRCGLDQTAWAKDDGRRCAALLPDAPAFAAGLGPFDLSRAYALYRSLFGGVEDLIADRKLFIVPAGPLASLPFQALVTEEPAAAFPETASGYADAAWLARRHALAVLPSVASLHALRRLAGASKATRSFMGFGNPLLTGPTGKDRRAWARQSCSKLAAARDGSWKVPQPDPKLFARGLASIEILRRQHPLPETTDELCAVGGVSGAAESDIYLGAKATETMVKRLSADGALAEAKVMHFATHGLLAGETRSVTRRTAEPALMLTPPAAASAGDDGLLTASEIAGLKLDADWVVLSACNTASGGQESGEVLSGLARAFFYAGARAALVSHWAVNSNATVKLITRAFDHLNADPDADRAQALRRAMLTLMRERGFSAHPTIWAPFVLVGDGAR